MSDVAPTEANPGDEIQPARSDLENSAGRGGPPPQTPMSSSSSSRAARRRRDSRTRRDQEEDEDEQGEENQLRMVKALEDSVRAFEESTRVQRDLARTLALYVSRITQSTPWED